MTRIAVLALSPLEHERLSAVWRFFKPASNLEYLHLYGGEEAGGFPNWVKALICPEQPQRRLAFIRKELGSAQVKFFCFAGEFSRQFWQRYWPQQAPELFYSQNHSLVYLPLTVAADEAEELVNSFFPRQRLATLEAERDSLPPAGSCASLNDFLKGSRGILLTREPQLAELLLACNPDAYTRYILYRDYFTLSLDLDTSDARFRSNYIRLAALDQIAASHPDPALLSFEAIEQSQPYKDESYGYFAEYYDHYMAHVDYEKWLRLMLTWFRKYKHRNPLRILELACGTANASSYLVLQGYQVDACDRSPFMLHTADLKSTKPDLFLASLTDPLPEKGYDFIFCLFDSINYLLSRSEIRGLLRNVHSALAPGGIFIFDISTLMNSLMNFNETVNYTQLRDGYMVHRAEFDVLTNQQISRLTFFRKTPAGYQKYDERHVQYVYRSHELVELIEASPLKLKAVFHPDNSPNLYGKRNSDLDNRYARLFYLLQKEQ